MKSWVWYTGKLNNDCEDFIRISDCDMEFVYLGRGFSGEARKSSFYIFLPDQHYRKQNSLKMTIISHRGCTNRNLQEGHIQGPWDHASHPSCQHQAVQQSQKASQVSRLMNLIPPKSCQSPDVSQGGQNKLC